MESNWMTKSSPVLWHVETFLDDFLLPLSFPTYWQYFFSWLIDVHTDREPVEPVGVCVSTDSRSDPDCNYLLQVT